MVALIISDSVYFVGWGLIVAVYAQRYADGPFVVSSEDPHHKFGRFGAAVVAQKDPDEVCMFPKADLLHVAKLRPEFNKIQLMLSAHSDDQNKLSESLIVSSRSFMDACEVSIAPHVHVCVTDIIS